MVALRGVRPVAGAVAPLRQLDPVRRARWPRPGADDQKQEWLPRLVTGEAILTPAWLEPENGFGPRGVQVRAVPDGDGFVITGTKRHVAFAQAATALVVLARTGDAPGDVDLFLVDPVRRRGHA